MPGSRNRDDFIAAAKSLFASRGFDGVTMRNIADALGLTQAALYYHFTSKDELAFVHAEIQRQPRTRRPHRAVRVIARLRKRRAHGVHHPRGRSLWSQIRGKVQPIRWLTFPNIAAMPQCRVLLNQQKYRE